MSVRKRNWKSPSGETREAWVVDYVDQQGDRHLKTFTKKRDADAHHAIVGAAVRTGTHTADSKSVTVAKAAELWLESCESAGLERATMAAYRQDADLHITPILGALRLSQLTVPLVRGLRGPAAPGRALASHGSQDPPLARRHPCRCPGARAGGAERGLLTAQEPPLARADGNGKLKSGVDIPAPAEMRAIVGKLDTAAGRHGPVLLTAIFTGLRASELRGLRWEDVDLKRGELHVRQRADRYNKFGKPKSEAGERTVPMPPMVVTALRKHRLASPKASLASCSPTARAASTSAPASFPGLPSGTDRGRCRRSAGRREIQGPALAAPLLRLVVHQPACRRRARAAAQAGADPARSRLDPDDRGHLRPPVPAR